MTMKKLVLFVFMLSVIVACGPGKRAIQATQNTPSVTTTTDTVTPTDEPVDVAPTETTQEDKDTSPKEEVIKPKDDAVDTPIETMEAFDHTSWNTLLSNYVSEAGNVDYKGFKTEWASLRNYLATLSENMPAGNWTGEDKLAYWMNAYNAMTVDLILRNYPLTSIKDIKDPWKQRFWKLGEKWYNLDEIEHQILRKMDEPRIHFGINCASFSCPPLLNEAFTRQDVDDQLERLAVTFVNDPKRNTISENSVKISKIFSWFARDFKQDGSVIDFLNKYSEVTINPKAKKSFRDYDWSLNE